MSNAPDGRMPALFIGHGNPMNAIERNAFHQSWRELGKKLPRPEAVLCVSAHWETRGLFLTGAERPETIHDFYGFPKALFDVRYPAPGDPALAGRIRERIGPAGVTVDPHRGLDHGAWSVLVAMYPDADVPVVQLSLDTAKPGSFHYALGKKLAFLRDEGILVIGSGNIVHNLRLFSFDDPKPLPWAARIDAEIGKRIVSRDHAALAAYESLGPEIMLAVPTPEHYFPLLYALALHDAGEPIEIFNGTVLSALSMTSVIIGGAAGG